MFTFLVFDDAGPARTLPLDGAHLLGADEVAQRADILLRDGAVICRRRGEETAALVVPWDAGPMGRLMLQTALLPPRERPYLLSLELARQRIKQFIAKSEEWQLFDLAAEHPAVRRWEEARALFSDAVDEPDPQAADRIAREAIVAGIDASERLALAHAEILLHRRFGARAAANTTLGIGVWPNRFDAGQQAVLDREADIVMVPLRWRDLEVAERRYDWERTDRVMAWAHERGKPIVAGPLLELTERALPPWAIVFRHDFDTFRDQAYDHMARVVERYRGVVGIWNLASGLNVNDCFSLTPDQMIALVRTAAVLVRQMRRGARTMVELVEPFGEHVARNSESLAPMAWLDRILQEGLQIDSLGVRLQFGAATGGRCTRDIMQVSALLDQLLGLDTHVMVTGLGVPAAPAPVEAGWWHASWSPQTQSEWIARIFAVTMSKPFIDAIAWGEIADHPGQELPASGLLTAAGEARPALERLVLLRRRLRRPLGALKVQQRALVLGEPEA